MDRNKKRKENEMNEILSEYSGVTQVIQYLMYLRDIRVGRELPSPISTGFWDLNYYLNGGLHPGQLITVGARPSVGKTAFAVSLIRNMLEENKKILFFSLEMSAQDIIRRVLAGITGISLRKINNGKLLSESEYNDVISAAEYLDHTTFYIVDTPELSIETLEKIVWAVLARERIDCILIDSFNLIGCADSETDRYKRISNVLGRLDCRDTSIVTMLQCPCDRKQREPSLADVPHDMYPLVNESDVVLFLHRPRFATELDPYDDYGDAIAKSGQTVKVIIEKNINGETGMLSIRFNGFTTSFERMP